MCGIHLDAPVVEQASNLVAATVAIHGAILALVFESDSRRTVDRPVSNRLPGRVVARWPKKWGALPVRKLSLRMPVGGRMLGPLLLFDARTEIGLGCS